MAPFDNEGAGARGERIHEHGEHAGRAELPFMTPDNRWLAETWPFVRAQIPTPPAQVVEIGCGSLGGFVPALRAEGYRAIGIDPHAPEGSWYRQIQFEQYEFSGPVDAVIACTSLHHLHDLNGAIDRIASSLVNGGTLVVIEWVRERFDEATAAWAFARLAPTDEPRWLHGHRERWHASEQSWGSYLSEWAEGAGLHPTENILAALATRFDTELLA
ncbi:MAG: class I SAM-dependent methyltransferase, partial [Chloroflexota bacterium]